MSRKWMLELAWTAVAVLATSFSSPAATWTKLTNPAPGGAGVMLQLTDGTIMIQGNSSANWMRLTPDSSGSYINGVWTKNPINPMSTSRLYFASIVLPSGRVWVLGGEYSDPFTDSNWSPTGEIYDPVTNSWSTITPYPNQAGCPIVTQTATGNTTLGSPIITAISSTTTGFQVGAPVTGTGIPASTTIASVDSATQVHISANATATNVGVTLRFASVTRAACFGDVPAILLPGEKILAGNLLNSSAYIYTVATNTWVSAANKHYNDRSDEEGWVKLPDGSVLTYDIFASIAGNTGYAEIYNPSTNSWRGISPFDGTAAGTLPNLSSGALGEELGPTLRLQDGRVIVIGANGLTGIYTQSTNTWSAGPNILGTLNGTKVLFGADDAPAALMPNGHVFLAADAGPQRTSSAANTVAGSNIITAIASGTALFQVGWGVSGTGIPSGATITSVDSPSQVHITSNATATNTGVTLAFGGTFSVPTQLFDFDPVAGTISALAPAIPDASLSSRPAFVTRMLILPTGQLLFSDSSTQLYVYTPDGPATAASRPVINGVTYSSGKFTLTGKQINGQSAGSSYGDDVQTDQNYPIVRMVSSTGNVYYCTTSNWSTTSVAGGTALQTVNFALNPTMTPGNYSLILSGSGISSFPLFVNITQAQVNGQ